MENEQIIWIVVAVVVIAVIAAVVMSVMRKRRLEQDRHKATELRQEARTHADRSAQSDLEAREAEAEAERVRLQAEQAEARAAEARRSNLQDEALVEDHVREADHVDPDATPGTDTTTQPQGTEPHGTDPTQPEQGDHRG